MTPRRVGAAVVAGVLVAVAIAVEADRIANLLFALAALLLSTQLGIPLATAAELGHPIGSVIAAMLDREQLIALRGRRHLATLKEIAYHVTRDRTRAAELAEVAIADARMWRGRIARDLDDFILCRAAYLAVVDEASVEDRKSVPLARRRQLAVVALSRRGIALADAETWLGCLQEPGVTVGHRRAAGW